MRCLRNRLLVLISVVAATLVPAGPAAASGEGQVVLGFGSCGLSAVRPPEPSTASVWPVSVDAVAVQPDGRIVLAGNLGLTRLMPDGSVDYSFGYNGTAFVHVPGGDLRVRAVVVQPDGRIVLGATKLPFGGAPGHFWMARYLADGTSDRGFGAEGTASLVAEGYLWALALQPDGKILAGGDRHVLRLLPDGALDRSFGTDGAFAVPRANAIVVRPDGSILVGGADDRAMRLWRLTQAGAADASFGTGGSATVDFDDQFTLTGLGLDSAGRIVSSGQGWAGGRLGVVLSRHLADGQVDEGFGEGGVSFALISSYSDPAAGLLLDEEDRPLVAFTSRSYDPDSSSMALARFTAGGRLDEGFGTQGTVATSTGFATAVGVSWAPGGDVVIGGFSWLNGGPSAARFDIDGSLPSGSATAATCTKEVALTPFPATDFGTWATGTRSTPRAYLLTSTGTAPVRVDKVEFSLNNRGQYSVVSDACSGKVLSPQASCQVLVSYQPTLNDYSTPTLMIWHNGRSGWVGNQLQGLGRYVGPLSAWGWNGLGAVGAGPPEGSLSPRQVNLPGVASITAGYFHSLAVRTDGTVWAWGWNGTGQLGDGTTVDRPVPVRVPGLTNIAAVAAGAYQSFAVGRDGSVWAWGLNHVGQLGDGTTVQRFRPVRLTGLGPVAGVATGVAHTLAVASDGTAWGWGWNAFGQVGDGTTVDRHVPVRVRDLGDVQEVVTGGYHSLAVTKLGQAMGWGLNHVGQVGDGTTVNRLVPTPLAGIGRGVRRLAGGAFHSLAIYDRSVLGWGWNAVGQVGDGTTTDRHQPVAVALWELPVSIAAGAYTSLVATTGSYVRGWGWNDWGQLGTGGRATVQAVPAPAWGLQYIREVSAGVVHTLAT